MFLFFIIYLYVCLVSKICKSFNRKKQTPKTSITEHRDCCSIWVRPHLMWNVMLKTLNYFLCVSRQDLWYLGPVSPNCDNAQIPVVRHSIIDSSNFSVRAYFSFFRMHGFTVYVKGGNSFRTGLISSKLWGVLCFEWLYFIGCLTTFSSINHHLCLCVQFLMLFNQTDEVLSINPCTKMYQSSQTTFWTWRYLNLSASKNRLF